MATKKIDFFGQFRPTGVDRTAGMAAQALAGLAGQAQSIVFEEAKKQAVKEGRQAGLEAGAQAAETGESPEMKGDFRFRDQAYNEGAILSYRAQVQRDTKETINRLSNEYELDPDGFREAAESYKQGITQGLPEELRFVVDDDISGAISQTATRIDDNAYQHYKRSMIADTVEMADDLKDRILQAERSGDTEAAARYRSQRMALMQRGVKNGLIDAVQQARDAESLLEEITLNREVGKLESIFEDDTLTMGEKILKGTEIVDTSKNEIYKDLSPDQRDALSAALQSELNEQLKIRSEMTAQEQKLIAKETIDLKLDAELGRRSPSEISSKAWEMFHNDQITESEYEGIITDLARRQAQKTEAALLENKVAERLSGNEEVLISQKENDAFYDKNVLPLVKELDTQTKTAYLSNYVKAIGSVPTTLKRQITNNLRSGDSDLILESAAIIDELDNIRGIETPVTPHDRAFASQLVSLSQSMEEPEALKLARELTDPQNKDRIEARERIIKDEDLEDDYESDALDALDTSFINFGDPKGVDDINKSQVSAEYKNLFETYFKAGMDQDQAKEAAQKMIQKNWSFSPSSDRVMKHPPENYYSVSGETDYIKEQLNEWVQKEASFGDTKDGYQKAFLVGDEQTAKLASIGTPDYFVYVQDNEGQLHLIQSRDPEDGKIKPIRWSPDKKQQAEKLKKANQEKLLKIRKENFTRKINNLDKKFTSGIY